MTKLIQVFCDPNQSSIRDGQDFDVYELTVDDSEARSFSAQLRNGDVFVSVTTTEGVEVGFFARRIQTYEISIAVQRDVRR